MDTRYALGIVVAGLVVIGVIATFNHGSRNLGTNATSTATTTAESPMPTPPTSSPTTPSPATPTPSGSNQTGTLTLALNESGTTNNTTLKPLRIVEDSRCPVNVQCIQAGTVRVSVMVTGNGGSTTQTFTLGRALIARGARITLTNVTPEKTTAAMSDSNYRFTFTVVPATVSTPAPTPSPVATGGCYVGGCSGQLCTDEPNAISTCEYRPEYACYKTATCARQSNGQCGWTQTAALQQCLANNSSGPLIQQAM